MWVVGARSNLQDREPFPASTSRKLENGDGRSPGSSFEFGGRRQRKAVMISQTRRVKCGPRLVTPRAGRSRFAEVAERLQLIPRGVLPSYPW